MTGTKSLAKVGGWGGPWVELEKPKPPKVANVQEYWEHRPPVLSLRCRYWVRQIVVVGWRPSRRISCEGYHGSAEWYGVYLWEYLNVVYPLLHALERTQYVATAMVATMWPAETGLGWVRAQVGLDGVRGKWTCAPGGSDPVVTEMVFAERPGGEVTLRQMLHRAVSLTSGDVLEAVAPLRVVLAEVSPRHLAFGVTLQEALA